MKKPYQIEAQRAVRQLEEMATDGNPAVQMVLPGAYCEGSANRPSIACNCRHAECGAGEMASSAG